VASEPRPALRQGRVILVGAGPGDPELITLKGVRALQRADVVLYDRLAHPALLEHAPAHALRIDVGKVPGKGGTPKQLRINALLVAHALSGAVVVRLKGGDPFVFGRGSEELLAVHAAGIPFEVIPGITSAIAVPAMALIPVSHRHISAAVGIFSAHLAEATTQDEVRGSVDWDVAARMPTAIFLMGVETLPVIAAELLAHGRAPNTPVAVIANGTLPTQRTIVATLATIVAQCADIAPPAVVVVGEVVALRAQLQAL
jgi:uroporphyrin-III C-methyltransferase